MDKNIIISLFFILCKFDKFWQIYITNHIIMFSVSLTQGCQTPRLRQTPSVQTIYPGIGTGYALGSTSGFLQGTAVPL